MVIANLHSRKKYSLLSNYTLRARLFLLYDYTAALRQVFASDSRYPFQRLTLAQIKVQAVTDSKVAPTDPEKSLLDYLESRIARGETLPAEEQVEYLRLLCKLKNDCREGNQSLGIEEGIKGKIIGGFTRIALINAQKLVSAGVDVIRDDNLLSNLSENIRRNAIIKRQRNIAKVETDINILKNEYVSISGNITEINSNNVNSLIVFLEGADPQSASKWRTAFTKNLNGQRKPISNEKEFWQAVTNLTDGDRSSISSMITNGGRHGNKFNFFKSDVVDFKNSNKILEPHITLNPEAIEDTELKILEAITQKLGGNKDVSGSIIIYSELFPCESCTNIIFNFRKKFPSITIKVLTTDKTEFNQ